MNSVSIVIPVRNGRDYIGEAIASGLAQGDLVSEIIVVDDGSTDGTSDIVAAIADPRVHLVMDRVGRQGVSSARNDGAARAQGDWLVFLDADDRLQPEAVQTLVSNANAQSSAVYGDYERIDGAGKITGRRGLLRTGRTKPSGDIAEALLGGNFIVNGGIMIVRRDRFAALGGFDETLRYCEDWHLWSRIALTGAVVYAPAHILDYRVYGDSVMMTKPLTLADYAPALDALFADPLVLARFDSAARDRLRQKAAAHLNAYAIGQAIRARRFGLALRGLFGTLVKTPAHFPKTLAKSGAALAGL